METAIKPARWKILLAFAIIYFVWGSTFFAIRVGVSEFPPFLFCAMRFLAAGLLVFLWAVAHRDRQPTARAMSSSPSRASASSSARQCASATTQSGCTVGDEKTSAKK